MKIVIMMTMIQGSVSSLPSSAITKEFAADAAKGSMTNRAASNMRWSIYLGLLLTIGRNA